MFIPHVCLGIALGDGASRLRVAILRMALFILLPVVLPRPDS